MPFYRRRSGKAQGSGARGRLRPAQIAKHAGEDGSAMIRLRFSTRKGAEWLIDDVFVDPRAR